MNNMYDKITKKEKRTISSKQNKEVWKKMKKTQKKKIIEYMKQFGSVTSWEAYRDLSITQFATRIKELKEEGYRFQTKWEKRKNHEGKLVNFKRFYFRSNTSKNDKK